MTTAELLERAIADRIHATVRRDHERFWEARQRELRLGEEWEIEQRRSLARPRLAVLRRTRKTIDRLVRARKREMYGRVEADVLPGGLIEE